MVSVSSYAFLSGERLSVNQALSYFTDEEVSQKSGDNNIVSINAHERLNEQGDLLTAFLEILSNKMLSLEKIGLEKIIVHVNLAYTNQCNWEMNPTQLTLLVKLKAVFTITAYETVDD